MDNVLEMLNAKKSKELINFKMNNIDDLTIKENEVDMEQQIQDEQQEKKKEMLNELFDDTSIKAEQSPFRTYPDDKQKALATKCFIDLGKVIQQYRNGEIDERTIRVLHIIVKHQYITTRQIRQLYLLTYHLYIKLDILSKILNRMMEKGLIAGCIIESSMGNSDFRCYCVDYNGVRLYTAIKSENVNRKRTDTIQKAYIIKRSIAKNQFLINYLKYYNISYESQPRLVWNKGGIEMAVKPALQMKFDIQDSMDSIVFLVEVIRTYDGWEEDYIKKLIRYGQYLKSVEDTQSLKKYYIVVCAESEKQVNDVINIYYDLKTRKQVSEVLGIQICYTCDILNLDGHYRGSLLSNLRTYQYDTKTGSWTEEKIKEFTCETHDWRDFDFTIDRIEPSTSEKKKEESDTEYIDREDEEERTGKQMLAVQIYNAVIQQGYQFPELMVRMAQILKKAEINYKEWGYAKLRSLFKDLSYFYSVHEESPVQQTITCTDALLDIINGKKSKSVNVNPKQEVSFDQNVKEQNIFYKYFMDRMNSDKDWAGVLRNDIFCYRNWSMTVKVLENMTHINDLSEIGWYNFIAYVYSQAKDSNTILKNRTGSYMGFCIELNSFTDEKIYLIAKLNNRENPKWILEGLATASSRRLGEILRDELGVL